MDTPNPEFVREEVTTLEGDKISKKVYEKKERKAKSFPVADLVIKIISLLSIILAGFGLYFQQQNHIDEEKRQHSADSTLQVNYRRSDSSKQARYRKEDSTNESDHRDEQRALEKQLQFQYFQLNKTLEANIDNIQRQTKAELKRDRAHTQIQTYIDATVQLEKIIKDEKDIKRKKQALDKIETEVSPWIDYLNNKIVIKKFTELISLLHIYLAVEQDKITLTDSLDGITFQLLKLKGLMSPTISEYKFDSIWRANNNIFKRLENNNVMPNLIPFMPNIDSSITNSADFKIDSADLQKEYNSVNSYIDAFRNISQQIVLLKYPTNDKEKDIQKFIDEHTDMEDKQYDFGTAIAYFVGAVEEFHNLIQKYFDDFKREVKVANDKLLQ